MHSLSKNIRVSLCYLLFFFCLYCLVYAQALPGDYLFSDDCGWLPSATSKISRVNYFTFGLSLLCGRPFYGILIVFFFWLADLIGIAGVRLVIVLLLSCFSLMLFRFFKRLEMSSFASFATAVAIGTLPSFTSMVSYLGAGIYLIPIMVGFAGGLQLWKALESPEKPTRIALASGPLLFVLALSGHQPSGQMFWFIPVALLLFLRKDSERIAVKFLIAGVVAQIIYFAGFQFTKRFSTIGDPFPRANLTHDPIAKVSWFAQEVLRNAANLWHLPPSGTVAWAVGAWILLGLARELGYRKGLLICALVVIAYTPLLVVVESWASYRTTMVLGSMFLLMAIRAGFSLLARVASRDTRAWVAGGAALVGAIAAFWNVAHYTAPMLEAESDFLIHRITKAQEKGEIRSLHLIQHDGKNAMMIYDEFGVPSSRQVWALEGMARFALLRLGKNPYDVKITHGSATDPRPSGGDTTLIDMSEFHWLSKTQNTSSPR